MIWAVALAVGLVIAAGTWLVLSRSLLRCLIGLALLGNGVNLLLYASGRMTTNLPPVIGAAESTLAVAANPLPQALVLTAIVISFALLCFSLVLAVRLLESGGSDDVTLLRAAEPPHGDTHKPALEEDR